MARTELQKIQEKEELAFQNAAIRPSGSPTSPSYYDIGGNLVSTTSPFFQGPAIPGYSGANARAMRVEALEGFDPFLQQSSVADLFTAKTEMTVEEFRRIAQLNPYKALNIINKDFLPHLTQQNFFGEGGLLATEDIGAFTDFLNSADFTGTSLAGVGPNTVSGIPFINQDDFFPSFDVGQESDAVLSAFRAFQDFQELPTVETVLPIDYGSQFTESFPDFDLTDPFSLVGLNSELQEFYNSGVGKLFLNEGTEIQAGLDGLIVPEDVSEEQFARFSKSFAEFRDRQIVGDTDTDTDIDTDTDTGMTSSDLERLFETTFGEGSTSQEIINSLTDDLKTQDEIADLISTAQGPLQAEFENFGRPAAVARGTEAGGGLGSGVEGASLRAATTFGTAISEVARTTRSAAEQQNLAIRNQALEMAKTPAQVAEIYSKTGVNLASIDTLMAQADLHRANAAYKDVESWATATLTTANYQYLQAQTTATDFLSLQTFFNVAQNEQGWDADVLANRTKYWMQTIGVDNPFNAIAFALMDMQTLAIGPGD